MRLLVRSISLLVPPVLLLVYVSGGTVLELNVIVQCRA